MEYFEVTYLGQHGDQGKRFYDRAEAIEFALSKGWSEETERDGFVSLRRVVTVEEQIHFSCLKSL